ncbi:MAG TPA: FecR domain-containing protein [Burkholderiales bacterium]|nr:FecR domain-containing protein [Burkholderiales bacterium]
MLRSGVSSASRLALGCVVPALVVLCATSTRATAVEPPPTCTPVVARIVSMQGIVELRRAGQQNWSAVTRLDTPMCQGDTVHAGPRSRAALVILPEKFVRLDQNSTVSISIAGEETVVEFFQDETTPKDACGAGYFITRFPRKFKVRTPFVNAAVEGTEFLVSMSCTATAVAVFEGKVSADVLANAQRFILSSGETLSAGPDEPPTIKVLIKPVDAVQWALYYPPLSEPGAGVGPDQQCEQPAPDERSRCLLVRAEQRLRIGRVDEAQTDIEASLKLVPDNSDADALSSVISVAKNDRQKASALAQHATELDPVNPRAWIALSYAQQASFRLEDALTSAQRAAELAPRSSIALTRVAELMLSLGKIRSAQRAAQAAVNANPNDSRAHTILGFVHLAEIDVNSARTDFEAAMARDSSDPLPRLGLGLATIRKGNLMAGREQIEIAVALDPSNSLLRSYMGKAYYEENTPTRDKLAATQFGLAKQLDPKDPTPWFYEAFLKESQNRPAEALDELQKSIELNDNTAVYRSKLLLDEDRASRTVSLARTYNNLGFEQLGILAATHSLDSAPDNSSAHRFLSDSYVLTPRHEIARVSELLQAQMLQPISSVPVRPCLANTDSLIGRTSPAELANFEYMRLFERDGPNLYLSGLGGDHGKAGAEATLYGTQGPLAYSLGACTFSTDGSRQNQDYNRRAFDIFTQAALAQDVSVQLELQRNLLSFGDLGVDFDPANFSPNAQNDVAQDSERIGLHLRPSSSSHLIASLIATQRDDQNTDSMPNVSNLAIQGVSNGFQAEVQYIQLWDRVNLIVGGSVGSIDQDLTIDFTDLTVPVTFTVLEQTKPEQAQLYAYGRGTLWRSLTWTLGASFESLKNFPIDSDRVNPKFGLRWELSDRVAVRFAAFQTTKRFLIQNQTLEPTEIAGFNQFFDDFNGTKTSVIGLGVDGRLGSSVYAGADGVQRRLQTPIGVVDASGQLVYQFESRTERTLRGYVYWQASRRLTIAFQPSYDTFERDPIDPTDPLVTSVKTLMVPLVARLNFPSGLSFGIGFNHVNQSVERPPAFAQTLLTGSDDFNLVDASISYWLPQRRGIVSFEARNLTDQKFLFRDDDFRRSESVPTTFLPERSFWVRLSLYF